MHRVVKATTQGSVGDLGRIARRLADNNINIDAIGGGEGFARGGSVGVISLLVTPDEDRDDAAILGLLEGLDLGSGRTLTGVQIHPALDLELDDRPGELAVAAELLGDANINIVGVLSVDVHARWAIVSLAFENTGDWTSARDILREAVDDQGKKRFVVHEEHGGRDRRRKVDRVRADRVPKATAARSVASARTSPGSA